MSIVLAALCVGCAGTMGPPPGPGVVKVTPLGSHDGEFCLWDRALIFEDPDGTRVLYDAGRTVRGPDDPRLGKIDVVLLSHVHVDHLGDIIASTANSGLCGKPALPVRVTPASNTVNIAAGKKSRVLVGSDMHIFLGAKIKTAGGDPAQVQLIRFGASAKVGGVTFATVPAAHTNGVNPEFLDKPLADMLQAGGLTMSVGPPTGYVVTFSNGLTVYLSGDTGITAEQDLVVRGHYRANLAVINIGGVFTTGPMEASYVITDLVRPNAVIASHANEAATQGGKLIAGSRTETFMKAVKVPVHVPLSGRTMSFEGNGRCVSGC
jgi:L-ascorbate metabolism protein UlaG (beta-lactamase superfamily)